MTLRHVFVRHAPLPALAGRCYGRFDAAVPASVQDEAAHALHVALPMLPIVSSPLSRCRALAEALHARRPSLRLRIDARLRELDFGDWEHRAWAELPREALDAWARDVTGFTPPGGESFDALTARVAAALAALDSPHVVITHAGVIRAAWRLYGMPAADAATAQVPHLQPMAID